MSFKYDLRQNVHYRNIRSLETRFCVVQQMPGEDNVSEPKYRIKAPGEAFERVVSEGELKGNFDGGDKAMGVFGARRKVSHN